MLGTMLARYFLLALMTLSLFSPSVTAQNRPTTFSVADLNKVESERDKLLKRLKRLESSGVAADKDLQKINEQLIAAAADSRRREAAATQAEKELAALMDREKLARGKLLQDEEALQDVLATLMRFSERKPPALATSPESASDAIRAAILMGDVAPKLAAEAEALALELDNIAMLQASIRSETETLNRAELTLLARREEIEALYAAKRASREALAQEAAALKAQNANLAAEANTLATLLEGLEKAAPTGPRLKPAPPRKFAAHKTTPLADKTPLPNNIVQSRVILRPVTGNLITNYGQTVSGTPTRGQTWSTRTGAQVVAPRDGRVEYAGPFRTYGEILILDVGEGYLVVLAGLESIYAEVGQAVLAGEPVGRMSDSVKSTPELYIEVRRNGEPVDPERLLGRST